MKHFMVMLLMTCTLTAWCQDKQAVIDVLMKQQDCWNEGDINCFMEGYWKSDSLMFVGSNGIVYGWQATLERYEKRYPDRTAMGQLKFDLMEIKPISPEAYFVVGQFYLTRTIGDLSGYFTLVLKKIEDNWVVVSDHTG